MANSQDLLALLAYFGRKVTDAPEIFPAFNNYYQDISGGQSKLDNLSLINRERMFYPGQPDPEYPDLEFTWSINGEVRSTEPNPKLIDLKPPCDGVVKLSLSIFHKPTGVVFERTEWAYLDYLDVESCPPDPEAPPQFGVFVPFYPDVNPYKEYGRHIVDFNNDGAVTSGDLTILLSKFGEEEE